VSSDVRRLDILKYMTDDLGYDAAVASRAARATMPLDDGRPASAGFEAEARKLAREFSTRSRGVEQEELDQLATDALVQLRNLAREYGESYYFQRYGQALAGAPVPAGEANPGSETENVVNAEEPAVPGPGPAPDLVRSPRENGGPGVTLERVSKRFGDFEAVRETTLEIADGEFFSLLGPSGCGKTTTLRMIAGFERPTTGRIFLRGTDVTNAPPHRRGVNTVFQSYALFPHLSVADNVAFGLRYKKATKAETHRLVAEALSLVQLVGFEKRKPGKLSGGQQQRVALARALVLKPTCLLLDEPLGALDAKLRRALQVELKALQQQVGITFVYVTHDQEEALTMSDRMAVMSDGRVEQLGTPRDVYEEPATAYVADFLGVSNLMNANAQGAGRVRLGDFELRAEQGDVSATGACKLVIRPERVRLERQGSTGENRVPALVDRLVYLGPSTKVLLRLAHGDAIETLVQNQGDAPVFGQGDPVTVCFPAEALRVLATFDSAPAA
jgi:spermidine/putrescine transport system ATP-binding protein